jgi:uncharacterized SAM-binding protein YcdF (DUF218 family)
MKSLALLVLVVLVWSVGLLTFADRAARMTPAEEPPPADAIVVLTGASTLRLETGLKLLEDGKGERLLVSGVNTDTTRADIQGITKAGQRLYDCCVDLGFTATDTVGNGRETAAWAAQHGFTDLIVVTAAYHMPRAMLEVGAAMPDAQLRPYPVETTSPDVARWWRNGTDARRMILEYNKYLAILVRESLLALGPKPDPNTKAEPAA